MGNSATDIDSPLQLHILATDTGYCNRLISSLRRHDEHIAASVQDPKTWTGDCDCDVLLVADADSVAGQIRQWHEAAQPGYPLLAAVASPRGDNELSGGDLPGLVRALRPRLALQRQVRDNRRQARQLHALAQQLAEAIDDSPVAAAFLDGLIHLHGNHAWMTLVGSGHGKALTGTSVLDCVAAPDRERLAGMLQAGSTEARITVGLAGHDSERSLHLKITPSFYKSSPCLLVKAAPVTAREETGTPATTTEPDLITRLDNLPKFTTRLDAAINAAVQENTASILLVARIDQFRRVQECLGRSATGQVLADIAGFLRDGISKPYTGTRLAADEFGILLYDATPGDGDRLADYINTSISELRLPPTAQDISLGVSTGLAVINRHSDGSSAVITRARLNCRNRRRDGSGDTQSDHSPEMAGRIRESLAAGRLALTFQPVVSFMPGARPCYETSCMLLAADGTPLPRDAVLACANLHDIGKAIDQAVIGGILDRQSPACFQVALSNSTLASPGMPAWLSRKLHQHRGKSGQLQLLVSEIDLHSNSSGVMDFCAALDAHALELVITDFGGAFDPLPILASVRPAGVRLDPPLVRDLPYSREQQLRLGKLIDAVHHQQGTVAVTALDDSSLLPLLFELGVDKVQGDCLQPPAEKPGFAFPAERILALPPNAAGKSS